MNRSAGNNFIGYINCEKKGGVNDDLEKIKTNCYSALNDDFNTPIVIANLFLVRFL